MGHHADSTASPSRGSSWLEQRLTRVTTSGRYFPEIDGLRFVAIALVFLQHFQQALVHTAGGWSDGDLGVRTLWSARLGVELFFLLSGFILGLPFVAEHVRGERPVALKAYFVRRLSRIEPPYVASLVGFYFYRLVHPVTPVEPLEAGRHFAASLLYVHNYAYGPWHPRAINTVTWSLEVEVQFYVLAPLLARVYLLGSGAARRGAIVLACAASVALAHSLRAGGPELPPSLLTYAPYFGAGLLLAELHEPGRDTDHRRARWDLLALATWGAAPFVSAAHPPGEHLVVAGVLFVAVYASLRSGAVLAILSSTPLRLIGGMCYSIYLLHYIAIWVLWRWLAIAPSGSSILGTLAMGSLAFVTLLPVFVVFYVLVERPCMEPRWWRRLWPSEERRIADR